jgi:serine/threonine-protein kinase HipA
MNRCPITYDRIPLDQLYSQRGLHQFSPRLSNLKIFPYTPEEQRMQAFHQATKISIPGVQTKLSVKLNITNETFEIANVGGKYILKPDSSVHPELPANEDVTMRMAAALGIETPFHGLIHSQDDTFTYFIKRFDRKRHIDKVATEDFAQLSGASRDTKYNASTETLIKVIDTYCTFPQVERLKLFERLLFSFLCGNSDLHLKNLSLVSEDSVVRLSPAYDLINSTIVSQGRQNEMVLALNGKQDKLIRDDFIYHLAAKRLDIPNKVITRLLNRIQVVYPKWYELLDHCFLSNFMKERYKSVLEERKKCIFGD